MNEILRDFSLFCELINPKTRLTTNCLMYVFNELPVTKFSFKFVFLISIETRYKYKICVRKFKSTFQILKVFFINFMIKEAVNINS